MSSGLIAWKLWRVHRAVSVVISVSDRRPSTLSKLLRIIVESQLLYTLFVALSLATQCAGDWLQAYAENLVRTNVSIPYHLLGSSFNAYLTDGYSHWDYL